MSEVEIETDYAWYPFEAEKNIEAGRSEDGNANTDVDLLPRHWIPAARVGQVINFKGGLAVITEEALKGSVGTWQNGKIFDNHKTMRTGFKIYADKFESPFLYFQLDKNTCEHLERGAGGSIDAVSTRVEDHKVLGMRGVGYSILSHNFMPACTKEAGCGVIEGAIIAEAESNKIKNKGGNNRKMADEEKGKGDMYTKLQVADITAAAVADVTERLENESKVALTDLGVKNTADVKKLSDEHAVEMDKQRVEVLKQATLIESLGTQYSLSDEQKKALMDAKIPEDTLTLFASLTVEKPGVIAASKKAEKKDGGDSTGGIVMGGSVDQKAAKTVKVPEIGSYDPIAGRYADLFREVEI